MYPVLSSANTRRQTQAASLESNHSHKRNANMIFRIEHLLPSATTAPREPPRTATTSTEIPSGLENIRKAPTTATTATTAAALSASENSATKRVKLQGRVGVFAAQFTPKDTLSETFSSLSVMSIATGSSATTSAEQTSHCSLSNSMLCMTPAMLRKIKLSEDVHSHNALFELHNGNVRVRIIRDIERNAELVAWFGEEATLLMSIPFLTPLNIQGNNRYTCHLCRLTFETPNPLKIHLALGCGRHSLDILWIRLHYALKAITFGHPLLSSAAPTAPLSSVLNVGTTSTCTTTYPSYAHSAVTSAPSIPPSMHPPSPRLSAFTRISAASTSLPAYESMQRSLPNVNIAGSAVATASSTAASPTAVSSAADVNGTSSAFMHVMHSAGMLPSHLSLLPSVGAAGGSVAHPLHAAAQIEAIVSNMGASKQGHLCIYCGKVYSRKYGLKIHIRTHTGFKPLKCKFCLRPFGDPSNLNKHVRLHVQAGVGTGAAAAASEGSVGAAVGAAPSSAANECYSCHLCHKTLARRRDLQRHMESRHSSGQTQTQRTPKAQRRRW